MVGTSQAAFRVPATHTDSMYRPAGNSSSSTSEYFWSECDPYDDGGGAGKLGGPSAGLLIIFITYCIEFLFGCPSNLWLVCHIFRQRSKVTGIPPADFFLLHLVLTQLCFYLVLPIHFSNHFLWQSNNVQNVATFLNSTVIVMKPLLLCLVCVERYMAVVRPLDYLRFKARRYRWGCVGVSWCIYFIMAYVAVKRRSAETLTVVFLPVLVIDTFCSLSVLKTLKQTPPGDREVTEKKKKVRMEEGEPRKEKKREDKMKKVGKGEMNPMKKKAFITIVIIQAVLTLNYLPVLATLPLDGRVPARTLKCQYWAMAVAAAASCSYMQPVLYLHRLGRLPCTRTSQHA